MSALPSVICLDFETEAIETRPAYPPRPVGVSIWEPGVKQPRYLAWGHPFENNCSFTDGRRIVTKLWRDPRPKLFHHAKFDVDVAETHLDLPPLSWDKVHDTMILAFLHNPHATTISLKPLAVELLKLPASERDELKEWILKNIPEARRKPRSWGAYIAQAPGNIVGRYANGDTRRTKGIFQLLYPGICRRGMLPAYDRERRLLHPLLDNERVGLNVATRRLSRDAKLYENALAKCDTWCRKRLHAPQLDVDSNESLADALDKARKMTAWKLTPTGERSTAKDALLENIKDKPLLSVLLYRAALATCVRTFMLPWLNIARETHGVIFTNWNQVRQDYHDSGAVKGARTGRLSSNPNFQNIPLEFEAIGLLLKKYRALRLPPLPLMRDYIVPPDKDHVILVRDYSQQELRILAHFEDGALLEGYRLDPDLDVHELARKLINDMLKTKFKRKPIKNTGFAIIYGAGVGKLAIMIDTDVTLARKVRDAYLTIFPDLDELIRDLKNRGRNGKPIYTWGGREYYVEPPKVIKERLRTFEYKLLNVLIQGSAADCTKQAIINYEQRKKNGRFILTVHDEIVAYAPKKDYVAEMGRLKAAMEDVKFDLPMLTDGKWSIKSWHQLKKFNDEELKDDQLTR